jgi:hypothetical protein
VPASPALATQRQRGSNAFDRREIIMARRSRAGFRDDQTLPCPAPAVNLDSQVGALPASG